ncbi:hypothetical protein BVC80_7481g1 [Macleaya cordata]|uniref:Uncharacterized protein n=1 Tax=Macleaya cordata TaxID=56857 RepID=A0A200Q586_MACCD|nr:hypothetical protein BVC80_7481g1 [Macleaya cordata]
METRVKDPKAELSSGVDPAGLIVGVGVEFGEGDDSGGAGGEEIAGDGEEGSGVLNDDGEGANVGEGEGEGEGEEVGGEIVGDGEGDGGVLILTEGAGAGGGGRDDDGGGETVGAADGGVAGA